jgi:hypothetical protein
MYPIAIEESINASLKGKLQGIYCLTPYEFDLLNTFSDCQIFHVLLDEVKGKVADFDF